MSADFTGAKIALIHGRELVTYLRDDLPTIPFPGQWDLPGGGREGDEAPEDCVIRETREEFGLVIPHRRLHWKRRYPNATNAAETAYFFAARITSRDVAAIRFGPEGQRWQMMKHAEFIGHANAVTRLQERLADYLEYGSR